MNHELLHKAITAAILAGHEILSVYDTDFTVAYKEDNSPLTQADKNASLTITECLKNFDIPYLSEEEDIPAYDIRKNWTKVWIIDPLDGTKEFVKRNGEFTVNIALAENGMPVIGVIFSPVYKDLYFAAKDVGAFKLNRHAFIQLQEQFLKLSLDEIISHSEILPKPDDRNNYVVVASRSHLSKETAAHIKQLEQDHRNVNIVYTGSSIKMCWVAEGIADEYPRYGPTMEWDTAAGHAILNAAGCELIDYESGKPVCYNRANLKNNWFIARRKA